MSLASRQIRHLTFLSCRHVLHEGFSAAKALSLYLNTISVWVNTARVGVGTISLVFCLTAHLRRVEVVQAPQTAGVLDSGVPLHLVFCFFPLSSCLLLHCSRPVQCSESQTLLFISIHIHNPLYIAGKKCFNGKVVDALKTVYGHKVYLLRYILIRDIFSFLSFFIPTSWWLLNEQINESYLQVKKSGVWFQVQKIYTLMS